jgi:hypothetical protein
MFIIKVSQSSGPFLQDFLTEISFEFLVSSEHALPLILLDFMTRTTLGREQVSHYNDWLLVGPPNFDFW